MNNAHTESVKSERVPPHDAQLNHGQPEVQHIISSSTDISKTTVHKKRKRSTDEVPLLISIKRSKLASVQIEPGRLKKKKKKPQLSPISYKISISREHLNHNLNLSSSLLQSTSKVLEDDIIPVNDVVNEPVKKVKKHKDKKKDKKLLLPVQGLCIPTVLIKIIKI